MKKFKNKYRGQTTRLANWDYAWVATYFVTICTKYRIHYFGEIKDGKMELSEIGKIAKNEWLKTFEMRPDMNLKRGEFVIMPNHIHIIIGIGENEFNRKPYQNKDGGGAGDGGTGRDGSWDGRDDSWDDRDDSWDTMHCVPTAPFFPTVPTSDPNAPKNQFGPQSKNLASIIRGFKIGVTKNARIIDPDFEWQSRFYDHIIRNNESYWRITNYIINNPKKWEEDNFNR